MNAYGWIWLRSPVGWRTRPIKRRICLTCMETLKIIVQDLEIHGSNDNLPIEHVVQENQLAESEALGKPISQDFRERWGVQNYTETDEFKQRKIKK